MAFSELSHVLQNESESATGLEGGVMKKEKKKKKEYKKKKTHCTLTRKLPLLELFPVPISGPLVSFRFK